jgi:nucleoid-associated protein YgaU
VSASTTGRGRTRLEATATLALLGLGAAVLLVAGRVLPTVPWSGTDDVLAWLDRHGPLVALAALARNLALMVVAYLGATIAVGVAARLARLPRLGRVVDLVSIPLARRAINGLAGVALTVSVAGGVAQASPATPPTMRLTEARSTSVAVMRHLPDHAARSADSPPPVAPEPAPAAASTATIEPGDHLWGVAARTLADRWQRAPDDREVSTYVRALIEHNAERLAVPGEPDLVFPGQVFDLPPVDPG